ncbi:MAG: SNF2-related protein [Clostridiales bacterium]
MDKKHQLTLIKKSKDTFSYFKGLQLKSSVFKVAVSKGKNLIDGYVEDNNIEYYVWTNVNTDGSLSPYNCSCSDDNSKKHICEHLIAFITYILDNNVYNRGAEFKVRKSKPIEALPFSEINFLKNSIDNTYKKIPINIQLHLDFKRYSFYNKSILVFIKIGSERLYKIKNIQVLINSITSGENLYLGKNFTYMPNKMCFTGIDKKIIKFFLDYYTYQIKDIEYQYNDKSTLVLSGNSANQFYSAMWNYFGTDKIINISNQIKDVQNDLDININLKEEEENILMEVNYDNKGKIFPLVNDFEFIYNNESETIIKLDKNKAMLFKKLYSIKTREKQTIFRINTHQRKDFIINFFNKIKNFCNIKVSDNLNELVLKESLVPKIYFDIWKNGIKSEIEFSYGEKVINPLLDKSDASDLIGRDLELEQKVLSNLEYIGMEKKKEYMTLKDDEKIVKLITGGLDELKKESEIYYSEDFKKLQVKDLKKIKFGISVSDGSLLSMKIDSQEFDQDELNEILESLKFKKKYIKLKRGSIINIDTPEIKNFSELLNTLDVDFKKIKDSEFKLNKNRAIFINNYITDNNIEYTDANGKFDMIVNDILNPKEIDYTLDSAISTILRDYQKTGVKWLKTLSHYNFGGILADDMGLGKTIQVLALLKTEKNNNNIHKPSIVISPTSVVYNWKAESEKFTPELTLLIIDGKSDLRKENINKCNDYDFIITSYGLLKNDIEEYKKIEFNYIFLDESQHIKNPFTQNSEAVKELTAQSCFALTGTPIENNLTELWSIFDFIMPGYLSTHSKFVKKFEKPIIKNNDQRVLKVLSKLIKPFLLRRLKSDVLKELPEKIESNFIVQMKEEQRKIYTVLHMQAKKEIEDEISIKGYQKSRLKILSILTRIRQICSHPGMFIENYEGGSGKVDAVMELINNSLDSNHTILLFSQFTKMLAILKSELDKEKIEYFYLDGSTKSQDRLELSNRFNNGERKVFLVSLKAGGTGLNLIGADTVIHTDPWWNPAVEDQATDRAYRIGQNNMVQVYKIITKGTIEEKIIELQLKKKNLINSVIQPGENLITKLEESELREILEYNI